MKEAIAHALLKDHWTGEKAIFIPEFWEKKTKSLEPLYFQPSEMTKRIITALLCDHYFHKRGN